MITVNAGNFTSGGVRMGSGASSTLTAEDADAIRDQVPGVAVRRRRRARRGRRWSPATRTGTRAFRAPTSTCRSSAPGPTKTGSFFSTQDVTSAAKVAVLGTTVNDAALRRGRRPGRPGHSHPQSAVQGDRRDGEQGPGHGRGHGRPDPRAVHHRPEEAAGHHLHPEHHRVGGVARPRPARAADAIAVLLRTRHKIVPGQDDDFMIRTLEEMADIRTQAMGTMTTLLAGIAGVSLIVGGIGIMNIMLVSVTERTREIGLRMAIGAKGRDVLLQFLVEAIALSLIGGGIGIALGFGLADGMARWMSWPARVPPNAVAMAFGFAAAVGVFFGFYPGAESGESRPDRSAPLRVSGNDTDHAARHLDPEPRQDLRRRRGRGARAARRVARGSARRVRRHHRPVGIRQVHADAHPRLSRSPDVRAVRARRPGRVAHEQGSARRRAEPEDRLRVSGLQPAVAHDGARQRRAAAALWQRQAEGERNGTSWRWTL